jgi:mono/diheme cytochrome c family protein
MPWSRAAAALALAAVGFSCARGGGEPPSPAVLYESDPAALRRGRLLFTGTCGGYCHPTKPGNRDAPYLFDCVWKNGGGTDHEIFTAISEGVPDTRMRGWGGKMPQGDDDIWKVVAYLRSKRTCDQKG